MKTKLLFLALLCACAFSAYAKEIPVNIKAEVLKFSEEKNLVTASGSVEVRLKGITLYADKLEMDTISNIVTAEGNVKMAGAGYDAVGEHITYHTSSEVTNFHGFRSTQSPPNIKGNLYLLGDSITDYKDKMVGYDAGITTCDNKDPHYFAIAKKVTYYPEDKIVGFSATFYERWLTGLPAMWAPYIYYDLKKQRKKNWTIGRNEVEGDFAKTVWDIPLPWTGTLLFLDYMEKKGIGYGLEKDYGKSSSASIYHVEEKDAKIQDWIAKINHNQEINKDTSLTLQHESVKTYLIPSGRADKYSNRIAWDHSGKHKTNLRLEQQDDTQNNYERYLMGISHSYNSYNTSYNTTLDQKKAGARDMRWNQRLSHSQPFLLGTNLKTNFNYNNSASDVGTVPDERLDADYTIAYSHNLFDLSFYENYYMDIDGTNYTPDSGLQYMEKQPEITLSSKNMNLNLFSLKGQLGYGWYHEVKYAPALGRNRDYAAGRYMAQLNANKNIPLIMGSTLGLGAAIAQYLYEAGDERYVYSESASLDTSLWGRLRNSASFSRGIAEGNSPFYFDTVNTDYSNIKEKLTLYCQNYFDWTSTAGYNFKIRKYDNYTTGMKISPTKRLGLHWRSGFDQNNKRYLDLTMGAAVTPFNGLTIEANANQDINLGILRSASSVIDWEIGSARHWQGHFHVKLGHVYDTSTQEHKLRDIIVVKDLHCWDVKYMYSDYRKEFSLTFTIKALPDEPFGWAPARGFYFDSFEKNLKDEFGQSSPRRY